MTAKSKLLRMDNVLIVVDDLEAAKAFFAELGMELEGEAPVEGRWVDRVVGLNDVRADVAMMRTPDGHSRLELTKVPHSAAGQSRAGKRAGERARDTPHHVRRRRHRRRRCPPAQPRCRTRRRNRAVRGRLPALLPAWPRGHHHRTGRAAQLKPPWVRPGRPRTVLAIARSVAVKRSARTSAISTNVRASLRIAHQISWRAISHGSSARRCQSYSPQQPKAIRNSRRESLSASPSNDIHAATTSQVCHCCVQFATYRLQTAGVEHLDRPPNLRRHRLRDQPAAVTEVPLGASTKPM